jgi:hypothetical protein
VFTGQLVASHGYKQDADNGGTLPPMDNIFSMVAESGGKSALYTSKEKFDLLRRSWPIDRYLYLKRAHMLVPQALEEMKTNDYKFVYLHIRSPDRAGHGAKGAKNAAYDEAVAEADTYLGEVRMLIENDPKLRGNTAIVLTADHGFADSGNHADEAFWQNFQIPFCSWGPGVKAGGDFYDINVPRVSNPQRERGDTMKTIRNAYAGVLSADWLGLTPKPCQSVLECFRGGAMADQYLAVSDEIQPSTPVPTASPVATPSTATGAPFASPVPTASPVATPSTATGAPFASPVAAPEAAPVVAPVASPVAAPIISAPTQDIMATLNRNQPQGANVYLSADVYLLDGATIGENNREKTYDFDETGFILVNRSPRLDAILRFEMPPGADEDNILDATLEVETLYGGDPLGFFVYQGESNEWDAASVNWSNVPGFDDGTHVGTFEATGQDGISRAVLKNIAPVDGHVVLLIVASLGKNILGKSEPYGSSMYSALSTNAKLTIRWW